MLSDLKIKKQNRNREMNTVKDGEWTRNGKGDKPRTNTASAQYQNNFDAIDWSSHKQKKSKENENEK